MASDEKGTSNVVVPNGGDSVNSQNSNKEGGSDSNTTSKTVRTGVIFSPLVLKGFKKVRGELAIPLMHSATNDLDVSVTTGFSIVEKEARSLEAELVEVAIEGKDMEDLTSEPVSMVQFPIAAATALSAAAAENCTFSSAAAETSAVVVRQCAAARVAATENGPISSAPAETPAACVQTCAAARVESYGLSSPRTPGGGTGLSVAWSSPSTPAGVWGSRPCSASTLASPSAPGGGIG